MIDFTEIFFDTDGWELFARDFLAERGFYIESTVDRGADQGKDMLVVEQLKGRLGQYRMRWLVSCKHYAKSGNSVSAQDEQNIGDRLDQFKADGFIGFYSTLASAGLNERLRELRDNKKIKDYAILDHKLIENALVTTGYSHLLMRYLPKSYAAMKPTHLVTAKYEALPCEICGEDLLPSLEPQKRQANVVFSYPIGDATERTHYQGIYVVHKEPCDKELQRRLKAQNMMTGWKDLDDLIIPVEYLRFILASMNRLRDGNDKYTDEAYQQEKHILIALAQRALRLTTEKDRERFDVLMSLPPM